MLLALLVVGTIDFNAEVRWAVGVELREDACGEGAAISDRIIICGVRKRPNRYRVETTGPQRGIATNNSGARPVSWRDVGATGTGSCGAVGPGGYTGCLMKQINGWGRGGGWRF